MYSDNQPQNSKYGGQTKRKGNNLEKCKEAFFGYGCKRDFLLTMIPDYVTSTLLFEQSSIGTRTKQSMK